jgi:hypothetical protein
MTRKSKRNYDIQMATPNEHKEKTREMGERDKGRGVEKNLLTRDITCPEWKKPFVKPGNVRISTKRMRK